MLVFGGVIGWNYFREFFEADAVLLEKPNQWILKRTLSPLVVGEQQVKRRQPFMLRRYPQYLYVLGVYMAIVVDSEETSYKLTLQIL